MGSDEHGLFGSYYVTPTTTALMRAWKLCQGSAREYQKLRSHALKLAYFPVSGDWDWIQSLPGKRIGELRIDEMIAGHNNVRVIFFRANIALDGEPLPRIWTLTAFQKKSNDFSKKEIKAFNAMRQLIVIRSYGADPAA